VGTNGPNALPEEKATPGWRRFLDEYRSYMQIILVAAAIVSLLIKEWSTAALLFLLTLLNAVVGLRQQGKAESAMNALKSMMKAFVLTFLGVSLFNIANGEPFTPPQVLWIHFVVNAAFGFALGFDRETPGLMSLQPRPRGQSVLTKSVMITVGLAGLAITIGLLSLIKLGESRYGGTAVGISMAFTSFALCLVVAAFECRSETDTVLTADTFDSKQMNWVALAEFVLAVLTTQMDVFNRLLGTVPITMREFGWALVPAIALLGLWELGKLIARRTATAVVPAKSASASVTVAH
jgi:Ca2+-transporting ATPase